MSTFKNLAKTFESFVQLLPILEASTLSKTGMPDKMVSAIHQKLEHWDKYHRMAHTYRGGSSVPMPFKYHRPAHDIPLPEPTVFTGKKTNTSPFTGRTLSRSTSEYKDFAWYLESLGLDQKRILITNPDLDFYMFIYDKSQSKGATGLQYAILAWDKEKKTPVDFGYSELTTREVDLSKIRKKHDTKGGNTSMKIQEYVRAMTREAGEKDYAPSAAKPLYVYEFQLDPSGRTEPRGLRTTREASKGPINSMMVIDVFADRYLKIMPKIKPEILKNLKNSIMSTSGRIANPSPQVERMADTLDVGADRLNYYLFLKMRDFRKDIYGKGKGSYGKTSGFELEKENLIGPFSSRYSIEYRKYSPEEEKFTDLGSDEDLGYREASPEKHKRSLPVPGEYASIQSLIKIHKLDGLLHKFMFYLMTSRIDSPAINILSMLGLDDTQGISDFESWII